MTTTNSLTQRQRSLVLAICCSSLLIVGMDVTIVNVALPAIRSDIGASVAGLQWVVDSYAVVIASLLILSGSTADRIGRRRIFQTGLALFTVGSLLCSVAPSLGALIAFRMLQAVGGSMLNPVALSIISNVFTDARERARAIGVFAGVVGLSFGIGPVLGGLLVDSIGWRSIFWVNVPVGIAAILLAAKFVPESRAPRVRPIDPLGQVLLVVVLVSLVYAIIDLPRTEHPWFVAALFAVSAVGAVTFVRYEAGRPEPLIDLRFFRSLPFSGAAATAVAAFGGFGAFLFLTTLYLQNTRGLSPVHAGLMLLPLAVMIAVCAPISGRIVAAQGPRIPLLVAGVAMLAGALPLTALSATTPLPALVIFFMLFGIGFGFVNSPITNAAVSGMPRAQSGVAAAIASTSRQVGSALGVAIGGAMVAGAGSDATGADFATATHPGWWLVAGCELAIVVLAITTTGARARASAVAVADRLEERTPARMTS